LASGIKTYGEDHPKVATYRNNLGSAYKALGQYQKAIDYYQLALVSDIKTYGEEHPDVARDRNNLGGTYYEQGNYQKALEQFQQALVIKKNSLTKNTQT
jgi:tetratricopeptide (TPR) repeat protein